MLGFLRNLLPVRTEKRSASSGFTAELIAARESYISGRRGIAELTATAQSCISLWEGAMALADAVGHQRVHVQAHQLAGGVAQQLRCRGVGQHDGAARVGHDQRIRVGREKGAEDGVLVDAGGQRRMGVGRRVHGGRDEPLRLR